MDTNSNSDVRSFCHWINYRTDQLKLLKVYAVHTICESHVIRGRPHGSPDFSQSLR